MKHDINNIATVSSKKTTLATIKKFIKENSILARINSHFTDYTRIDIVRRSKAFINATFDIKKNKIMNAEGFEIFELSNFTKNVYTKYEDENFIGYTIYNCVADVTIVTSKNQ